MASPRGGFYHSARERALLFNHFPVFPETTHNLWDAEEVVELLAAHPSAIAHFNGHLHQGGYAEHGGVHFVTFKALLETKDIATCALITLGEATLTIEGFGNQPSFELPYR